jgi:NDP-sugar pyrophosphorylase family protein
MFARYRLDFAEDWIQWIDGCLGVDWKLGGTSVRSWMSDILASYGVAETTAEGADILHLSTKWIPDEETLGKVALAYLRSTEDGEKLFPFYVEDEEGRHRVAWLDDASKRHAGTLLPSTSVRRLYYPWDLLPWMEFFVQGAQKLSEHSALTVIDPSLYQGEGILMASGSCQVKPGVVIEGTVVLGKECSLGPNCYLRGPISMGDRCRVGQAVELKNSALGDDTCIPHLSYVGDSILGSRINLGAGTKCSNYRHDGSEHKALLPDGTWVATGRTKWGTVLGHDVKLGCNSTIYPGRMVAPKLQTRPGEVVEHNLWA